MGNDNSKPPPVSKANITPTFSIPEATGNRIAILVGNNYELNSYVNPLKTSINNANNMKFLLKRMKFTDISLMTDDLYLSDPNYPSKSNIIQKLTYWLSILQDNDSLVFYYSGHGGLVEDGKKDVTNSTIVPTDYTNENDKTLITNDELRKIFLTATKGNVFVILDYCNTGTGCNLRYNILNTTHRSIISKSKIYNPNEWKTFFKTIEDTRYQEMNTNILSLSDSQNSHFSSEGVSLRNAPEGYQNPGSVLTTSLFLTLGTQPLTSKFADLIWRIKMNINSWGFLQTPQFMAGKLFDENMTFDQYMFK